MMESKATVELWDDTHKHNKWKQQEAPALLEGIPFTAGMRVLDIGCGNCGYLNYLHHKFGVEAYGIDISQVALDQNTEPAIQTRCAEATALPFEDNFFDFIYSFGAIEHTDTLQAVRESARVLKPGGTVLHTVPNLYTVWTVIRPVKKLMGAWNLGLEQSFSRRQFARMFRESGLMVTEWYTVPFVVFDGQFSAVLKPLKHMDNAIRRLFKWYGFFLLMKGTK